MVTRVLTLMGWLRIALRNSRLVLHSIVNYNCLTSLIPYQRWRVGTTSGTVRGTVTLMRWWWLRNLSLLFLNSYLIVL